MPVLVLSTSCVCTVVYMYVHYCLTLQTRMCIYRVTYLNVQYLTVIALC